VVRINYNSNNDTASNGTYFQQRKVATSWDFWAAIRDARLWGTGTAGDAITGYGRP